MNMWTPLLLIALWVSPTAPQSTKLEAIEFKLEEIETWIDANAVLEEARDLDLKEQVETLQNATAQLLGVLNTVRSRQAASSAVQVFMALAFLAYLATIAVIAVVKRCKKVSERQRQREFERLEMQLRSSKAKRRAAAAKEKSAQAQGLE